MIGIFGSTGFREECSIADNLQLTVRRKHNLFKKSVVQERTCTDVKERRREVYHIHAFLGIIPRLDAENTVSIDDLLGSRT